MVWAIRESIRPPFLSPSLPKVPIPIGEFLVILTCVRSNDL